MKKTWIPINGHEMHDITISATAVRLSTEVSFHACHSLLVV